MNLKDLFEILVQPKPSSYIRKNEEKLFEFIPELKICKGFNQNNPWHVYDVYEHILHVIDGVPSNLILRLTALFHDIGKPLVYTEDEKNIGHFYNHWNISNEIFLKFAKENHLSDEFTKIVSKLLIYHDYRFEEINEGAIEIINKFSKEEIKLLFDLKRSDLKAQNPIHHNLLEDYAKQEENILLYKNNDISIKELKKLNKRGNL